jgi:lysozyme family protein
MAKANYRACSAFTFRYEGGFVNHPKDPGGATNWGITKRVLEGWRGRPVTIAEVRAMTKTEAADIYRANYWNAVRGDDLPKGVDLSVWDYGVNSGPSRSIKDLQRCLGVKVDGFMGPATCKAAREAEPVALIKALCDRRRRFVRGLKPYKTFGKGWERRINALERTALRMVGEKVAQVEDDAPQQELPQGKADPADKPADKGPPVTSGSGTLAGGGLINDAIEKADKAADVAQKAEGWAPFLERLASQPTFWIGAAVLAVCLYFLIRHFLAEKDDD